MIQFYNVFNWILNARFVKYDHSPRYTLIPKKIEKYFIRIEGRRCFWGFPFGNQGEIHHLGNPLRKFLKQLKDPAV